MTDSKSEYTKPLPDLEDPLTAPFWSAAREGTLVAQKCAACGYLRWPPGPICNECQTPGGEWTELSPTGTLYSYAEYHRALAPAFKDDIPYVVALVELDEGPRMYGQFRGKVETGDIGRKVRAAFEPVTADVTFVRWEVA